MAQKALLGFLVIITLSFTGCGNNDENDSRKVAEDFLKTFYTIDTDKLSQFDDYNNAIKEKADALFSDASTSSVIELQDDTIPAFYLQIQPLMTEKAFDSFEKEQGYRFILACKKNNATMQAAKFTLTETFYDSKENKIGFDYKAELKIISNSKDDNKKDIAKGNVGLVKENGQWKVYSSTVSVVPKIICK